MISADKSSATNTVTWSATTPTSSPPRSRSHGSPNASPKSSALTPQPATNTTPVSRRLPRRQPPGCSQTARTCRHNSARSAASRSPVGFQGSQCDVSAGEQLRDGGCDVGERVGVDEGRVSRPRDAHSSWSTNRLD